MLTVADLIKLLEAMPQELFVAVGVFSEHRLLEPSGFGVEELCKPRPDGWIQDKRPDKESQNYLVFYGN